MGVADNEDFSFEAMASAWVSRGCESLGHCVAGPDAFWL